MIVKYLTLGFLVGSWTKNLISPDKTLFTESVVILLKEKKYHKRIIPKKLSRNSNYRYAGSRQAVELISTTEIKVLPYENLNEELTD